MNEIKSANFQERCQSWVTQCMGEAAVYQRDERAFRFLEESLELGQAAGVTREQALQIVNYVFGRPKGELHQEVGGTMTTLASLCNAFHITLAVAAEDELERCWVNIHKIREKALAKRTNAALPGVVA